jgi:phospholipid-binding lipoprotein MlaA
MAMEQAKVSNPVGVPPVAGVPRRREIGSMPLFSLTVVGVMAALVAGCATPPTDPAAKAEFEQNNDPLEPANRYIFEVNRFADFLVIKPWADTYRRVVPAYGRERLHNVLGNMGQPLDLGNELLQGRFSDGADTAGRFLINSTVGVGGLFDVATGFGLPDRNGDFGQTLYSWGISDGGPYLVLPLLGPSNPRDAVGLGVDMYGDPVGYAFGSNKLVLANDARFLATAVDERAEYIESLDALEKSSIDFYAQMRSMARQHRAKELGQSVADTAYPSFDSEPAPPAK